MSNLYTITIQKQDDTFISMEQFAGKLLLIVNTATHCGFTPQYSGLQTLYERYHNRGLEILDFPCNQFKEQAQGSDDDINAFCTLHYQTTFPRFKKIDVNGIHQAPIFMFLKQEKQGIFGEDIKWNFTKFLVSKDGEVVKRYAPQTSPETIEKDILHYL